MTGMPGIWPCHGSMGNESPDFERRWTQQWGLLLSMRKRLLNGQRCYRLTYSESGILEWRHERKLCGWLHAPISLVYQIGVLCREIKSLSWAMGIEELPVPWESGEHMAPRIQAVLNFRIFLPNLGFYLRLQPCSDSSQNPIRNSPGWSDSVWQTLGSSLRAKVSQR